VLHILAAEIVLLTNYYCKPKTCSMKKLSVFLASLLLAGITLVQAQTVRITGTVTSSEDGMPMPGVSVVVKGTTIGVTTDVDGKYDIKVPTSAQVLQFSFVGYEKQELEIAGRSVIDVVMNPESKQIDEVVVVAYGVKTKQSKTGALSVVKNEELTSIPVASVEKSLQGRVSGVQINNPSGAPGASSQIVIRGASSINAGTSPLWVVDGIPVVSGNYSYATTDGNILASLNPNDIESITILKDAAAASIYGSRAANGVILVTTKSGRKGKANFGVRAESGFSTPLNDNKNFRFMNAEESLDFWRTAAMNAGFDPDDPASGQYYLPKTLLAGELTNWWNEVFQTGKTNEVEVSASGGNDKTNYYFSGNYFDQQGIQINSFMKRYSARLNVETKLTDNLTLGVRLNGSQIKMADRFSSLAYGNPFWAAQSIFPWTPVKNPDGTWNWNIPENNDSNPVAVGALNDRYDDQNKYTGIGTLEWNILEGLTFRTKNSIDYYFSIGRDYRHPETPEGSDVNGQLYNGLIKTITRTTSNTLSYVKSFNDVHNVSALVGFEAQDFDFTQYDLQGEGMGADIPYLNNATSNKDVGYGFTSWSLVSYFANAEYNYNNKYFVTASFRTDGSSRFGKDNRYGYFPAFGAAWNISNEDFLKGIDFVNLLKLRGSWGTTGNWQIGNYETLGSYSSVLYNGVGGLAPASLAKPDLSWELTKTYNIGLDFTLFERLDGTLEYFNKKTEDMLLDVPISQTSGFSSLRRNVGSMRVWGVEALLNGTVVKSKDFMWNVGFNITYNKYEILDLAGQDVISDGFWRRYRLNGDGFSEYYVYDWAGVNPVNGLGLWYDDNGNITQNFNNARRVFRGKVEPDYYGGITTDLSWKGLTVSLMFDYKVGHSVYVMERRYVDSDGYSFQLQTVNSTNFWRQPGDIVPNPKPIAGNPTESNAWGTSRFLEKGDYLKFKQLSIGYNLPKKIVEKLKVNNLKVYTNIYNVFAWHDVSYFDPERDFKGGGYAVYPNPFTITFGLKLDL